MKTEQKVISPSLGDRGESCCEGVPSVMSSHSKPRSSVDSPATLTKSTTPEEPPEDSRRVQCEVSGCDTRNKSMDLETFKLENAILTERLVVEGTQNEKLHEKITKTESYLCTLKSAAETATTKHHAIQIAAAAAEEKNRSLVADKEKHNDALSVIRNELDEQLTLVSQLRSAATTARREHRTSLAAANQKHKNEAAAETKSNNCALSKLRIEHDEQVTIAARLRKAAKTATSELETANQRHHSEAAEAECFISKIRTELDQERARVSQLQSLASKTADEEHKSTTSELQQHVSRYKCARLYETDAAFKTLGIAPSTDRDDDVYTCRRFLEVLKSAQTLDRKPGWFAGLFASTAAATKGINKAIASATKAVQDRNAYLTTVRRAVDAIARLLGEPSLTLAQMKTGLHQVENLRGMLAVDPRTADMAASLKDVSPTLKARLQQLSVATVSLVDVRQHLLHVKDEKVRHGLEQLVNVGENLTQMVALTLVNCSYLDDEAALILATNSALMNPYVEPYETAVANVQTKLAKLVAARPVRARQQLDAAVTRSGHHGTDPGTLLQSALNGLDKIDLGYNRDAPALVFVAFATHVYSSSCNDNVALIERFETACSADPRCAADRTGFGRRGLGANVTATSAMIVAVLELCAATQLPNLTSHLQLLAEGTMQQLVDRKAVPTAADLGAVLEATTVAGAAVRGNLADFFGRVQSQAKVMRDARFGEPSVWAVSGDDGLLELHFEMQPENARAGLIAKVQDPLSGMESELAVPGWDDFLKRPTNVVELPGLGLYAADGKTRNNLRVHATVVGVPTSAHLSTGTCDKRFKSQAAEFQSGTVANLRDSSIRRSTQALAADAADTLTDGELYTRAEEVMDAVCELRASLPEIRRRAQALAGDTTVDKLCINKLFQKKLLRYGGNEWCAQDKGGSKEKIHLVSVVVDLLGDGPDEELATDYLGLKCTRRRTLQAVYSALQARVRNIERYPRTVSHTVNGEVVAGFRSRIDLVQLLKHFVKTGQNIDTTVDLLAQIPHWRPQNVETVQRSDIVLPFRSGTFVHDGLSVQTGIEETVIVNAGTMREFWREDRFLRVQLPSSTPAIIISCANPGLETKVVRSATTWDNLELGYTLTNAEAATGRVYLSILLVGAGVAGADERIDVSLETTTGAPFVCGVYKFKLPNCGLYRQAKNGGGHRGRLELLLRSQLGEAPPGGGSV
eukprot:m.394011 g.394011  ORF g.394011 m.394011 type:complete len:1205 (+) comp28336_c1_seq2:617-4231(+)